MPSTPKVSSTTRSHSSTRRGYHHGNLAAAALREARRLLSRRTRKDFTLPEVARALGVSHAALYRHFAGKRGLLAALALEGHQRFAARLEEATRGLTGRALMRATARCYCAFGRSEPALFRAMFHPSLTAKEKLPALAEAADANFERLGTILRRLEVDTTASDPVLGATLWSALHGIAALEAEGWLEGRARLSKKELEETLPQRMADVLYDGLRTGA